MGKVDTAVGVASLSVGLLSIGYLAYKDGWFAKAKDFIDNGNGDMIVMVTIAGKGTISPSPGTYPITQGKRMEFNATPAQGFQFDGWYSNGQVISLVPQFSIIPTQSMNIVASFTEIGAPVVIPNNLKPVQNASVEDHWILTKAERPFGLGQWENRLYIESYEKISNLVKFKLQDEAGNPVPNEEVAIYTDDIPDSTGYGYLLLNGSPHSRNQGGPLIVKTDANGIAQAMASYWWYEGTTSNYKETIGSKVKVHVVCIPWIQEADYTDVFNGWEIPGDIVHSISAVFTTYRALVDPLYAKTNTVHAYWVKNPNLTVLGDCFVECTVKIKPTSGNVEVTHQW